MAVENFTSGDGIDVIKLGGSVLTGCAAYGACAQFLADRLTGEPDRRLVVVVSAQYGETDALHRLAGDLGTIADPAALDLLWSTGETRSAALLTLALRGAGMLAVGLSVHETGLRAARGSGPMHVALDAATIRARLREHPVVVCPGFLACDPDGRVVTLGRGGSDLSAVVLAAGLGARRCELIKDVSGYFTADPNRHADATPIARLSYSTALRMSAEGCGLIQARALEEAARTGLPLLVRSLDARGAQTWVTDSRKRAAG